jgi:putative DNA methylase
MTKRLIEEWLPIESLGMESIRERAALSALPAIYYLHVWWARRPLVAARAAILASLLPADADREKFMSLLGIHGDPVAAKRAMEKAKRAGIRIANPYGYARAFQHSPGTSDLEWLSVQAKKLGIEDPAILDPTAGGGAIPLEAMRLGCRSYANDLNPVAITVQRATYALPCKFGRSLISAYDEISSVFISRVKDRLSGFFAQPGAPEKLDSTYLWARSIACPYCDGEIPLSPSWKLDPSGIGVMLVSAKQLDKRVCEFTMVKTVSEISPPTVKGGKATCPHPDCGRVIDASQLKSLASQGLMGDRLYAVVLQRKDPSGASRRGSKSSDKWIRDYRIAAAEDRRMDSVLDVLAAKIPEWEALDIVPSESLPLDTESWSHGNTPAQYGAKSFRDLFSPRQLLCHGTSVEVFREIYNEYREKDSDSELQNAAFEYLAVAVDRMIDWNSRQCTWELGKLRMAHTFHVHAFPLKWSYAEMDSLALGLGYEWSIRQTRKAMSELIGLSESHDDELPSKDLSGPLFEGVAQVAHPAKRFREPVISCKSAADLDHLSESSIDCIVMDPPYYDNVMYAELSDFFYVWMKRTFGIINPSLFGSWLTNKQEEAVANHALFPDSKSSRILAKSSYREKMGEIFSECRRVLKDDGIMTLMFTHKATGAWDALTKGLIDAGFVITASWPINTEAEGSLHIKDKSAANSTIFLVCRPRPAHKPEDGVQYWEDLEPRVKVAVRKRIEQFQSGGIRGVDLYLSCFGPALEEFSLHWPIKRGQPKPIEEKTRKRGRAQLSLEELLEQDDPYAVSPEDALLAARREVKAWRMEKLTSGSRRVQLDPLTEWFVLAWDAFQAPQFPFDEALRLARVVGLDLDKDVVGVLAEKKASDLILWDSSTRATKGKLGAPDGTRSWIDAIHHCAHRARSIDLNAAKQLLDDNGLANSADFLTALEAVLEVLPLSARYTGFDPVKAAVPAASDFEALENLRRLALAEQVAAPKQLELVLAELAEA